MNIKKSVFVVLLLVAALLGGAATYGTLTMTQAAGNGGGVTISADEYDNLKYMNEKYAKAEKLWNYVQKNFYQDITDEQIEEGLYKGIFNSTGDIYSGYMNPDEWEQWETSATGEFEGVGVTFLQDDDGKFVVVSTVKDSPAEKGGLKPGDILTKVDGKEYEYDNVWLAPAMKGRYCGGGMMLAPGQDRNSDLLTVIVYTCKSKLKSLKWFPLIFEGKHVELTDMTKVITGRKVHVRFSEPCAAQIDGETVLNVTEYTAEL